MVKPEQSHFKDKVTTFFLCAMLPKSNETFMFLFTRITKIMIENTRPHDATRKLAASKTTQAAYVAQIKIH